MCFFYHEALELRHKIAGVINGRLEVELVITDTECDSMNLCITYAVSSEEYFGSKTVTISFKKC